MVLHIESVPDWMTDYKKADVEFILFIQCSDCPNDKDMLNRYKTK